MFVLIFADSLTSFYEFNIDADICESDHHHLSCGEKNQFVSRRKQSCFLIVKAPFSADIMQQNTF